MSILTAGLHKGIATVWDTSLKAAFQAYWSTSDRTSFTTLNDGEAAPGTPFPYCVFEQGAGTITDRMSGDVVGRNFMIQGVPWFFRIHAGATDTKSAKTVALELAAEVLKVFGGYPDAAETPVELTLDSGSHIITQYVTDYGIRTSDEVYLWTIEYRFFVDMPVAI